MKSGHFGLNKYPRKESPLSNRYLDLHLKVTKNGKREFLEIEIGKYTPKMWEGHLLPQKETDQSNGYGLVLLE